MSLSISIYLYLSMSYVYNFVIHIDRFVCMCVIATNMVPIEKPKSTGLV